MNSCQRPVKPLVKPGSTGTMKRGWPTRDLWSDGENGFSGDLLLRPSSCPSPSLPSLIPIDSGQSLLFARQWDGVIESDKVTDRPTADGNGKRFQLKGMAKHSSPAPATSSSKWGLKLSCGFYAVQQASRLMVRSCDRVCLTRTVSNLRPKCFSNPHVDDARCCCCPLIPFGSFSEEKMWANREGTAMTAGPTHSLPLSLPR